MKKLLAAQLLTAGVNDLRELAKRELPAAATQARHMYAGYHLGVPIGGGQQDFSYWRGPLVRAPTLGTEQEKRQGQAVANEFTTALTRSFTSTNIVKEVLRREIASCTAKVSWTLLQAVAKRAKPDSRTKLEQEADALTTAWWRTDRKHPERAVREALLFARREGRGVLRFRVAGGLLEKAGDGRTRVRSGLGLPDIARYIRLEVLPHPENAQVWEHPDTFKRAALYAYGDDSAETCFVDPDGDETLLRVLRGPQDAGTPIRLRLGGRITYIEVAADALITEQFLQNQMAFNTASTMILRNTELAGFLERYGINVEPPYETVPDPDQPGKTKRVYKAPRPGAGSMVLWRQATYRKADAAGKYLGDEPLGKAEYGRFEPVSPEALISAVEHSQLNMYGEAGQTFVLMGKDATASGRSREVALSDFDNVRQPTTDLAEATVGEVIETFLALVAALGGVPGRFEGIQVEGTVRQRLVPPSAEDRKADREDVSTGVISLQTARQRQGVDDSEQEDAQIARERETGISPTLGQAAPVVTEGGAA